MKLDLEKIYSGFKVLRQEYVEEQGAQCYELEHLQSGARLLYMDVADDNKVFIIGFRTPNGDDTGVAHIMEHSVLCGSKKYPLKEPFVELVKGSLNTFLNAMTYPDKTVYPVASRNAKDFDNLMDVYLDAVFNPSIYENPYVLRQEGWHYEIQEPAGELQYNGVVYNEMKGVYSNPDSYLDRAVMQNLFPDNIYAYESGGFPEGIPALTQEKFLDFHRRYYSPENAKVFLYGDVDIEKTLQHISEGYLNRYYRTNNLFTEVEYQRPLPKTRDVVTTYPEVRGATGENKVYHELAVACERNHNRKDLLALKLLSDALISSESGPLKRALLEAKVAQNIVGNMECELLQPVFSIRASGSTLEKRELFLSTIYKELQRLTQEGINKELLEGGINATEFRLRENEHDGYPKGLMLGLAVLGEWNYDEDPVECLRYKAIFQELREGLKTDYYEKLLETYLLDNTHKAFVSLVPEPGRAEAEAKALAEKLAEIKAKMTSAEIQQQVAECAELHRRQGTPDSPENLATIPILQRGDIRRPIEEIPAEVQEAKGNTLLYVPQETNGIVYLSWNFDLTNISAEDLPYVSVLGLVLGKMDTEKYTYQELEKQGLLYTGGMHIDFLTVTKRDNGDDYQIRLQLGGKVLREHLDKFLALNREVVHHTKFSDAKRFREIIEEVKTSMDESFFSMGRDVAVSRLHSYLSAASRVTDLFDKKLFIKDLYEHFDERCGETLQRLETLYHQIFSSDKVLLTYSCDRKDQQQVARGMQEFLGGLPKNNLGGNQPVALPQGPVNEAITCAGKVQYVVLGGDYRKAGFAYTGAMAVLKTILSYEYLWINVRVKGGAYGAFVNFTRDGMVDFSTYRDPQLVQSLEVFRQIPAWVKGLQLSQRELDKYVIGTISSLDRPFTKESRMQAAEKRFMKKTTPEFLQQIRNQVLDVTMEDLQALATVLERTLERSYHCVVGGKEVIESNAGLFGRVLEG